MPTFLTCAACDCPVRAVESACPHCGATMRSSDGSVPRAAAAILLGLVTSAAACGDDDGPGGGGAGGMAAAYGVPETTGVEVGSSSSTSGSTSTGSASTNTSTASGTSGSTTAAGTSGSTSTGMGEGGGIAPAYGMPGTDGASE